MWWRLSTTNDPQVGTATMVSTVNIRDDDGDEMPSSRPGKPHHVERTGGSLRVRPSMPDMVGGDEVEVIGHELYMTTNEALTYKDVDDNRHVNANAIRVTRKEGDDLVNDDVRIMDLRLEKNTDLTIASWRLIQLICMPQFYGKGCTKACPGYGREANEVYTCSGHGTCASGEEATGACECDEGYAGVDCSEGDSGVSRSHDDADGCSKR